MSWHDISFSTLLPSRWFLSLTLNSFSLSTHVQELRLNAVLQVAKSDHPEAAQLKSFLDFKCPNWRTDEAAAKDALQLLDDKPPSEFAGDALKQMYFMAVAMDYQVWKKTLRLTLPPKLNQLYAQRQSASTGAGASAGAGTSAGAKTVAYKMNPSFFPGALSHKHFEELSLDSPFAMLYGLATNTTLEWYLPQVVATAQSAMKLRMQTLVDHAARFLKPFALAFVHCTTRPGFRISLSCSDFEIQCRQLVGSEVQPRVMFDRIYLSNVTDYTTLLPMFTVCTPLLRREPHCCMAVNDMTHCSFYRDVPTLLSSTLALPSPDFLERLCNVSFANGNSWMVMNYRQGRRKCPGATLLTDSELMLSTALLQDYLKQLFVRIAMPPMAAATALREMNSMTLQSFVLLLDYLHRHVGYPAHVLSDVVDEILSGTIRGRFRRITTTPNTSAQPFTDLPPTVMCVTPYVEELRNVLSIWEPSGIVSTTPLSDTCIVSVALNPASVDEMVASPTYLDDPELGLVVFGPGGTVSVPAFVRVASAMGGIISSEPVEMSSYERSGFNTIFQHVAGGPAPFQPLHLFSSFALNTAEYHCRLAMSRSLFAECAGRSDVFIALYHTRSHGFVVEPVPATEWTVSAHY